ncbi:MAG: radical SAM protein [Desulfobacteraceae bacterium]|uniref:Radical SAM protein n=1 Tax=Candidatus Desulfacyla euxinica TaxID=2841693 RepID=A0A8J6MZY3_9DELT|nr:radical SAM protein [Candidatus Desulfacyla euxinica]MBL6978095.1 radical SAM protein [Desulfobacteraceae bacterium]MBL7217316.1 radical SAM protein [Desulfobacteraceae bacterium]
MRQKQLKFEQGPIRPPSEARSLLLRVTRNCPWNQCQFCPVYKKRKFSLRTVEEIKQDIETVKDIVDDVKAVSWKLGNSGIVKDEVINSIFANSDYNDNYRSVAAWIYYGTGACFLQDADNMIMKTRDLVDVLEFLRKKLPDITRITTYSRSRTVVRKSVESLKQIREAGLGRIHIGLETAYDPLLKLMKKGVKGAQQIEAGQKVVEAGMELSEYIMPGLGGQEMWREHAVETAKALNQINPHFIRLRSLRVPEKVPLYEKLKDGSFTMQTDDMVAEEIKLFIETLDGITSMVTSDHIMNLLEEVTGRLPQDKEMMLETIRKYQALPDLARTIFRIGRRGGTYRSTDDLEQDASTFGKIKELYHDIESKEGIEGVEKFITDMVDRYI